MPDQSIFRRSALAVVVALAAACEPSTAPDLQVTLDTEAALADYDAVESVLSSPDWAVFTALGGRTPFSSPSAVAEALGALGAGPPTGGGRAYALALSHRLANAAARAAAPARAPIISDTHRGATFVYDHDTDEYAVDPAREGAPLTGVRFILYEVDDAGRPIVAEEIGHADLVDEGDGSAEDVVLHLLVVVHEATLLDYRATVDIGLTWGAITVHGFLQGADAVRLDFDIEARGTRTLSETRLDVAFDLAVQSRNFSISGSVSGIEGAPEGEADVTLTVRHGSHTLEVDVSGMGGQLDGSVSLNGELFATVTGDRENPTILSADGDPLTEREQLVLYRVLDTVEDVFDLLEDLVDPVDEIVLVGFIL